MASYAFPKYQYAVWDGTNLAEIQDFVAFAFVAADGSLQYPGPPGGGIPIATQPGVYVVGLPGGTKPLGVFDTEADFLANYTRTT